MTLSIRDPEADKLAREIAEETGEPITTVVKRALKELRAKLPVTVEQKLARVERIVQELNRLPRVDNRTSKELLDDLYDEHGLPK